MLPSNLLRTRIQKGTIKPIYAKIDSEDLRLGKTLIDLFEADIGKRKGELLEKVAEYESKGFDFRLVRGLSLILQRRCDFMPEAEVEPVLARKTVFEKASGENLTTTPEKRKHILKEVARRLKVSPTQLDDSLYADLEDQLVLKKFNAFPPIELIQTYNLSLTQTLLFKATFMEIRVSDYWKEVLRAVKYRGLIYSAENRDGIFKIAVDGPFSLLKQTQRYGASFAQLLPIIVQSDAWEINASIIRTSQFGKRILQLRLSNREIGELIPSQANNEKSVKKVCFDSLVEEKFFEEFSSLRSGWKVIREPTPLIVGNYVFIPDFLFIKHGVKVYFEIMGFWTSKYLMAKIRKLQQLQNVNMLIAANMRLACDKLKEVADEIIFYKNKVPLKLVLNYLNSVEEAVTKYQAENLDIKALTLEGEIISIEMLAAKFNVSKEALIRRLEGVEISGYRLVGGMLVSNEMLYRIKSKITSQAENSLVKALKIIEDEGISKPYEVLYSIGYIIRWKGLDPQNGQIRKMSS